MTFMYHFLTALGIITTALAGCVGWWYLVLRWPWTAIIVTVVGMAAFFAATYPS